MEGNEKVIGREKVVSVFGYWPSFHDGTLVSFSLDRAATDLGEGPTMEAAVHGFEITDATNPQGYLVLHKHILVRFRFAGVWAFRCDSFYSKYELSELSIEAAADPQAGEHLDIRIESVFGAESIVFKCRRMEVVSVQTCDAGGKVLS